MNARRVFLIFIIIILIHTTVNPVLAITRGAVMAIARSYANFTWQCKSGNYNNDWNDWVVGKTYTGVPYNWGGFDMVFQAKTKINNGITAGNNELFDAPTYSYVHREFAGVDCAGFVSRCWELFWARNVPGLQDATVSTPIPLANRSALKPGDMICRTGHAMLFKAFTTETNQISVYEANVNYTDEPKDTDLVRITPTFNYSSFYRYNDIIDDMSDPSISSKFNVGDSIQTIVTSLNIRNGPGRAKSWEWDTIGNWDNSHSLLPQYSQGQVLYDEQNGLFSYGYHWWYVQMVNKSDGKTYKGWCAEFGLEKIQNSISKPTVETRSASSITETAASFNGRIVSDGGSGIIERAFSWGITEAAIPGWITNVLVSGDSFSYNFTGLSPGTTYYFRAFATNSLGSSSGNVLSFTTLKSEPNIDLALYRISDTSGTRNTSNPGTAKTSFYPGETVRVTLKADNTGNTVDVNTSLNIRKPDNSTILYDSHDSSKTDSGVVEDNTYDSPLTSTEGYDYYSFDKVIPQNAPLGNYDIIGAIQNQSWTDLYDTTAPGRNDKNWGNAWASDVFAVIQPPAPTLSSFNINNGTPTTTSQTVTLNNTYIGGAPTQYMASESSSFSGATWQTYSASPSFPLSSSYGVKTVYLKLKNNYDVSGVLSDTIDYQQQGSLPVLLSFNINGGTSTTTAQTVTLNNAYTGGTPTQYMASESSSFSGASWQTYSTSPSFTLSSGSGTKTVYLRVRNTAGISNVLNDSIDVVPPSLSIIVTTNISSGTTVIVDGTTQNAPYTTTWVSGSSHTIEISSPPQSGGTDKQYVFQSWSDSGSQSHTVSPTSNTTYTATLLIQWKPTITLNGTDSTHTVNTETHILNGSDHPETDQSGTWSEWCDNGTTLSFTQYTTSSPIKTTSDTHSWTVNSAFSATINYVFSLNTPPVAVSDSYSIDEDISLTIAAPGILFNDTDIDTPGIPPPIATLVTSPLNGTLTWNVANNGLFTYMPNPDWNGTDSFTYKANDGIVDSNAATVSITISAVNDAPVAINDAYTTPENTSLIPIFNNNHYNGILFNDTDIDSSTLTVVLVSNATHGILELNLDPDGSFKYTPANGYTGTDSFTYMANDGALDSNTATVSITVTPGDTTGVSITASNASGIPDSTVEIPINIGDTTGNGIIGVGFKLDYDPTILTATSATTIGTIASGWGAPTYNVISGQIAISMSGTTLLSGLGILVKINFNVVANANSGTTSALTLSNVKLNGGDVPANIVNGVFTVDVGRKYGDVSGDGYAEAYDAALVQQYEVGLIQFTPTQLFLGDVSGDGDAEAYDAALIKQYDVGIIDKFPVELETTGPVNLSITSTSPVPIDIPINLQGLPGAKDIQVPVNISGDVSGLGIIGVGFKVTYDASILTAKSATTTETIASGFGAPTYNVTSGQIAISMSGIAPLSGSGALVNISFDVADGAVGGNTSDLNLVNVKLNGGGILATTTKGLFTVIADDVVIIDILPTGIPNPVDSGETVNCSASANDSLGHAINYSWVATGGSFVNPNIQNPVWSAPVNNGSSIAYYTLTVTATCGEGKTGTKSYRQGVNPISEITVQLYSGWNMVSCPIQPIDNSITSVMAGLVGKYNSIFAYNTQTNSWQYYIITDGNPIVSDLTTIDPNKGYWINMKEDATLTITGQPISDPTMPLLSGWNLTGYKGTDDKPRAEALSSIYQHCMSMFAYNTQANEWQYYINNGGSQIVNDLDNMYRGKGYWINSMANCIWDTNSSPTAPMAFSPAKQTSPRPEIPYIVYGNVDVDGVKVKNNGNYIPSVFLKVDGKTLSTYRMLSNEGYGEYYTFEVPITDNTSKIEIYVELDGDISIVGELPIGLSGKVTKYDISYRRTPKESRLLQNYPNPFNPETWIPYQLSETSKVAISIYNINGRLVRKLDLGRKEAGIYTDKERAAYWDGRNEEGEQVSSGIYFYQIQSGKFSRMMKSVMLK